MKFIYYYFERLKQDSSQKNGKAVVENILKAKL